MNTENPKTSIIVPVYNTEKYLKKCIESILIQSDTDFELILIDDGSKDNSGKICDLYALQDSRITVKHKLNGGVSSARNLGLDIAKGERICFIDSDDYVDQNFLEIFNKKDADIIMQGFYAINWPGTKPNKEFYVGLQEVDKISDFNILLDIMYQSRNIGYLPFRAFKKSIIEKYKLKFNPKYKIREDEEFICRYLTHCQSFATINEGSYHYEIPDYNQKYSTQIVYNDYVQCAFSTVFSLLSLGNNEHPLILSNINRLGIYLYKLDLWNFFKQMKNFYIINKNIKDTSFYCRKVKVLYYISKLWAIKTI